MKLETVFVYGSLKRGFQNHALLAQSVAVGNATTKLPYVMLRGPGFPFLLQEHPQCQARSVHGELYAVNPDTLAQLDALEGHPHFYEREAIELVGADGSEHWAWCYFLKDLEVLSDDHRIDTASATYNWQIDYALPLEKRTA